MTGDEWLGCTDIYTMLDYLRNKTSDRKLRLFAVACCRRPYYSFPDDRHRKAVLLAERMADEAIDESEWTEVHHAADELWRAAWAASLAAQREAPRGTPEVEALVDADMSTAAGSSILEDAWEAAYQVTGVEWDEEHSDEPQHQLALLRDVFGNPFKPMTIDIAWRTSSVLSLAKAVYDERHLPSGHLDPQRLAILADALEDAGCQDAMIVSHLRSPGPHVRGCVVVDLLLGKE